MQTYYTAVIKIALPEGMFLTCVSCPKGVYRNSFIESYTCGITGENVMKYYAMKTLSPSCTLKKIEILRKDK